MSKAVEPETLSRRDLGIRAFKICGALALAPLLTNCAKMEKVTNPGEPPTPENNAKEGVQQTEIVEDEIEALKKSEFFGEDCPNGCAVVRFAYNNDGTIKKNDKGEPLIDGGFFPPMIMGKEKKPQIYAFFFEEPVTEAELYKAKIINSIATVENTKKMADALANSRVQKERELTAAQQKALDEKRIITLQLDVAKAEKSIRNWLNTAIQPRKPTL